MGKTYRSEYSILKGNPFRIVGAGNYLIARIRAAAPEGKLVRFTVLQNGGTAVPFTVDWLDSLTGLGITTGEFTAGTTPLPVSAMLDKYRVMNQTSAAAGVSAHNLADQAGYSYSNQDNSFSNRPREIYMILVPSGNGANTVWELTAVTQNTVG